MQLLDEAVDSYEVGAMARWWERESASANSPLVHGPTGPTRPRLGREATDEEIADDDLETDERIALSAVDWMSIISKRLETELLAWAGRDGLAGTRAWLVASDLSSTTLETRRRERQRSTDSTRESGWLEDAL
jgi:hypothetical protein